VSESSAGIIYAELTASATCTSPSLSPPSSRHLRRRHRPAHPAECLEVLGAYGKGKVNKLAEIVAGTVLAGELSLAAASPLQIGFQSRTIWEETGSIFTLNFPRRSPASAGVRSGSV